MLVANVPILKWYNGSESLHRFDEYHVTNNCTPSASQLMRDICASGAVLSAELLSRVQHQRHLLAAPLRTLLTESSSSDDFARGHALVLLSSWGDAETLTLLGEILVRHHDTLEPLYDLLDDTIPAYGSQAIPMLGHVLLDGAAPRASRIAVCSTLSLIGHLNPLTRRTVTRMLRAALPDTASDYQYDPELWSWVVVSLTELRSHTLRKHIDQLFHAGMLDPGICGRPDDVRKALNDKLRQISFRDPILLYTSGQ
jgi:hypothetical protein